VGEIHHGLVEKDDYNTIVEGVAQANHRHCAERVVFVHMTHYAGSDVLERMTAEVMLWRG